MELDIPTPPFIVDDGSAPAPPAPPPPVPQLQPSAILPPLNPWLGASLASPPLGGAAPAPPPDPPFPPVPAPPFPPAPPPATVIEPKTELPPVVPVAPPAPIVTV